MVLKVNNISKIYGTQKAVDQLSFTVNQGEIVGLLGPNGAGKSTTMKVICGLTTANSGSVAVNGLSIEKDELAYKKQIGYLSEQNPLYGHMYIPEFLEFMGTIHKIPGQKLQTKIAELVKVLGLSPELSKKIDKLSKGYKQRVGLAHCLLHAPNLLILDEPTTGLDPIQLIEIRSVIKTEGQKNAVLFSTHIMQEVEALCDRIIVINQGKIIAQGTTASIKEQYKSLEAVFLQNR
jgi:ABC-2 type transport system ATP-binding protein